MSDGAEIITWGPWSADGRGDVICSGQAVLRVRCKRQPLKFIPYKITARVPMTALNLLAGNDHAQAERMLQGKRKAQESFLAKVKRSQESRSFRDCSDGIVYALMSLRVLTREQIVEMMETSKHRKIISLPVLFQPTVGTEPQNPVVAPPEDAE